jgi:hypothetical protein
VNRTITIIKDLGPPVRSELISDIFNRIIKANEKSGEAETDAKRRYHVIEQLDALADLAAVHGLGAHLRPTRRAAKAIAAIAFGSFDPFLGSPPPKNPGNPPSVTQLRAYLAASADWFVKDGAAEDEAARKAAQEANHKDVGEKQIKKWRRQYSGAGDISTFSNALGSRLFRDLTSKMPIGCNTANEVAVYLAQSTKYF